MNTPTSEGGTSPASGQQFSSELAIPRKLATKKRKLTNTDTKLLIQAQYNQHLLRTSISRIRTNRFKLTDCQTKSIEAKNKSKFMKALSSI